MTSNSVQEFERRCEAKKEEGLVDLKFCTFYTSDLTAEAFCKEANSIDAALARGDFEELTFEDPLK